MSSKSGILVDLSSRVKVPGPPARGPEPFPKRMLGCGAAVEYHDYSYMAVRGPRRDRRDGGRGHPERIAFDSLTTCSFLRRDIPHVFGSFANWSRAMLGAGLEWAHARGAERMSVDCEASNIPAVRFWSRHFRPVAITYSRLVEEGARAVTAQGG